MPGPVFPWRDGNEFELLIDGPEFFPRMLLAIVRAEFQVDLELYLVEAGRCADAVVEALEQAASRGVRVRCLFDDYGSLAFPSALRQRLEAAGDDTAAMVSQKLNQPLTRTLIGYVQLIGLGLLAFGGQGAYNEWSSLDPATRALRSQPVGWRIARYDGVSDGWDDFKGYYQNRQEAVDA